MRRPARGRLSSLALTLILLSSACGGDNDARDGVIVEPLTPTPGAARVVRPDAPGLLEGALTSGEAFPGLCPNPYPAESGSEGYLRIVASEEVPAPAPPELMRAIPDVILGAQIDARLREEDDPGRYAVVVKNLRDGRGVAINADRLFYAASLYKLEVMFEAFHQREAGLLDFEERYVASDHYAGQALSERLIAQCDEISVEEALGAMMSVSDNVAGVMVQDRVGAANINASMRALGLTHTVLLRDDAIATTAADVAVLLEAIATGQAVSERASQEMATLMATEKVNDRIPAGLPEPALVAHKTGNWENATHDAGIVYGDAGVYVIVLMSDVGFDGDAASVQRDIVRIIWERYEGD